MLHAAIACLLTMPLATCSQQRTSHAEPHPAPKQEITLSDKVYTYVEQMPQLPGGGGQQAIANEILKRLRSPSFRIIDGQWPESRVKVSFVVAIDGTLQDIKLLVSSHNPDIDKALLNAVYTLPCLTPGYQNGQPVRVQLTFPIGLEYR